jgi:hypothetical protein
MKTFFDQNLQFTYVQASGEDFSPQKIIFSTSNPDSDTDPGTLLNPDPSHPYPDPQHCKRFKQKPFRDTYEATHPRQGMGSQ